jgi:hypothetical protein
MVKASILQICTKQCKNTEHEACHGSWEGFGFEISCNCICHSNKKRLLESEFPRINNVEKFNSSCGQNENIILTYYNNFQIKEKLEQRVVRPRCSNTSSHNQSLQQHGVLLDD